MACFLVPAAEALVSTVVTKIVEKKEKKAEEKGETAVKENAPAVRVPFSQKLKWLCNMLWGGCILLAFEHVWHGEVVPWFPFLTAAGDPEEASAMLHEMATVGVTMAVVVTVAWLGLLGIVSALEKRVQNRTVTEE